MKEGRKFLVCGSSDRMKTLRSFLKYNEYENLYILDSICCGILSELIFKKYIGYLEENMETNLSALS